LVREELMHSGRDLDSLETRIVGVGDEPEGTERRFFLTDDGEDVAGLLAKSAPKEFLDKITAIKDMYGSLALSELIHYVYTKYPESASRSRIRGRILGET
jgi:hypothetical protein